MPGDGKRNHLLLTGATGFLGKVVLEAVLRRWPELEVTLIMRPRGRHGIESRFRRLVKLPCFSNLPPEWPNRVHILEGDLSHPGAGLSAEGHAQLINNVTHVIHCAASIEFDLPIQEAARANVDSTLNVMELARSCPSLRSVVSVSTAYVTSHQDGNPVYEVPAPLSRDPFQLYEEIRNGDPDEPALLRETGRPNTYTLTKALAEHLLIQRYNDLPLSILRPSVISACIEHPAPAWIDSGAAFAGFVYLVGAGHLQELVGNPRTRLDIVPCDVVTSHILDQLQDPPPPEERPRIRHSTAGVDRSTSIRESADEVVSFFREYQVDRLPRIRYLGSNRLLLAVNRGVGATLGLLTLKGRVFRRRSLEKRHKADEINARFRHFMLNTFDFRSSLPWPAPPVTPREYIRTICRGVYRHMMRRDESQLLVAGRKHTRVQQDWYWLLTRSTGPLSTRLGLYRVRRHLSAWAHRVTIDEPALLRAREDAPVGSLVVIHPVLSHSISTAAVLTAFSMLTRPTLGFGAVWVLPEALLPHSITTAVLPEDRRTTRTHLRPWILATRDHTSETPVGTVSGDPEDLVRMLASGVPTARIEVRLETDPDEHTLSQQEDASSLLLGKLGGYTGMRLLRRIAGSLPAHHGHVRSAHLHFEPGGAHVYPVEPG